MKPNAFNVLNDAEMAAARLVAHVDLDAIAANWRLMDDMSGSANAGAVVKANAYGHGMAAAAIALAHAGCTQFFTASIDEAITLRGVLPENNHDIAYFDGLDKADIDAVINLNITPSINTPAQLKLLAQLAATEGKPIPAMLQLDTGMNRLGFNGEAATEMLNSPDLATGDWRLVFTHLIAGDNPENPLNHLQLRRFNALTAAISSVPRSIAATAGIMLGASKCEGGADFHDDVTRPGLGLYGISPNPNLPHGLTPVLTLSAKVLQIRNALKGETVGYDASHTLTRDSRLATIAGGYADGINRKLSNQGNAAKDGMVAPMIGRVSMDVHVIDITDWPPHALNEGDRVMLIGGGITVEDIAKKIDTIPYEVLTTLGLRAKHHYASAIIEQFDR